MTVPHPSDVTVQHPDDDGDMTVPHPPDDGDVTVPPPGDDGTRDYATSL